MGLNKSSKQTGCYIDGLKPLFCSFCFYNDDNFKFEVQ
jgi:hypothetical protein